MFCLTKRQLIRGCQAHINAGLGCGADYVAVTGTPLYAPKNGTVSKQYTGNEGGKWLWFTDKDGNSLQFAHLSEYVGGLRNVNEGDLIAKTGNTGSITTGPHLHVQILKNGVRLDPEKYKWDTDPMPGYTEEDLRFESFKGAFKAVRGTAPEQSYIDEWKASGLTGSLFVRSKYYVPQIKELEGRITARDQDIQTLQDKIKVLETQQLLSVDELATLTKAKEIIIKLGA